MYINKMASSVYETFPTQRNFLVQPTGAGGMSQIEYQGTQGTVNSLFQTTGTGTWTFQLPKPLQYQLQVGTQFTFQNLSTGLLTLTADDGSTIGTISTGTQVVTTMKDVGNTSSSWAIISSPSTAYVGILPVISGGTGNSVNQSSPIASTVASWDGNRAMHGQNFVETVIDYTGSSISFTNANLPGTVLVKAGGGNESYTLPNETTAVNGTHCRFMNVSNGPINILTVYGGVNILPSGYLADYEFVIDNTSGKAWLGYSRPISNISAGIPMSLDAPATYGSAVMNVPFTGYTSAGDGHTFRQVYYAPGSGGTIYNPAITNPKYYLKQAFPYNYNMDRYSSKTTVVNNFYYDPLFFTAPTVFLPDVSTIPVGSTYEFYYNNKNGGNVNIFTSKANLSILPKLCLGYFNLDTNIKAVCMSNNPNLQEKAWMFLTSNPASNINPLEVVLTVFQVVTSVVPVFGWAYGAISSAGILAADIVFDASVASATTLEIAAEEAVACTGLGGLPAYSLGAWTGGFETLIDAPPAYSVLVEDVLGNVLGTVPANGSGVVYAAAWGPDVPFPVLEWALAAAA